MLEGERQAVVRDGETPHRRRSGGVVGRRDLQSWGLRALLAAAVGPDRVAREGGRAEHQRQRHGEARELQSGVHPHERSIPPGGIRYSPRMSTTTAGETRGYTATKDQLLKRLRRIQGQVGGIERMIDDDRYCIDVLTQITAAQAALDKVALGLLDDHARHCVVGGPDSKKEERTEELMAAVGRMMRRG